MTVGGHIIEKVAQTLEGYFRRAQPADGGR